MSAKGSSRANVLHALTVASIAGGTHVLWALLPLPALPPPPPAPAASLTALPDARPLLASPVLFSLPSSLGFSSVALQHRNRILPPLHSPLDLSLHTPLDLPGAFPQTAPDRQLPPLPPAPVHPPALLPLPDRASTAGRWQLHALETTPDTPPLHMFRPPQRPVAPKARHITGIFQFNPYGQVETLLIDPAPAPPSNDILQSLRLVRIPQTAAPLRIPFELTFQPPETLR